jgi:hypothetical protein
MKLSATALKLETAQTEATEITPRPTRSVRGHDGFKT